MPQKRINRKKLIETLERTRQTLDSAIVLLIEHNNTIMASSIQVTHNRINDLIVELVGESYPETWLDYYRKQKLIYATKEKY